MTESADRSVIVTGAAGGIGRATCEYMNAHGFNVLAVDRDESKLSWTVGHEWIVPFVADISLADDNMAMVRKATDCFGGIDAVVLNAAVSLNGGIESFPLEDFDRLIAVNLKGTVMGIRYAIPALRARGGGAIIVVASTHGLGGDDGFWAYAASKHGLIGVVKSVAREVGWEGIRVNAVCPGPVRATAISTEFEIAVPEVFQEIASRIPVQRWGEPREIAAAISFLASPDATYITGIAMPVDGGTLSGSGCLGPARNPSAL